MFATLAMVAASLGLGMLVDEINRIETSKGKLTANEIAKRVDSILNRIRQKSTTKYNEALDAIERLPNTEFYAGAVKDKIRDMRREAQSNANRIRDKYQAVEQQLGSIQQRSANLQMSSDAYRLSQGKKDVEDIERDLKAVESSLDNKK